MDIESSITSCGVRGLLICCLRTGGNLANLSILPVEESDELIDRDWLESSAYLICKGERGCTGFFFPEDCTIFG